MAWFSGKVSLGNFPDLAGAVNKLSESVKNIEKNFDTALGFEDKSDSSTSTEDSGKAELESNLQPPEPVVHDVKIPDSVDELQGKEISKVGHAENPDTLEIKVEAPRVDEVEAASILHNKSHDVFRTESPDEQETQAEEIVEQSSIQAEASSDTQAEALDDVQSEASTDILAEASNDNRAEASSDTQAEAAVDSSSSQPISSEVSSRAHELFPVHCFSLR
ncbi:GOLGIN CANDIDATE 5 [Salix koriyanagi]|uniref:GOLGIN CANDIDATE 5 n=1 Tax=Salix koriyanagi TaxID=2511006 RepID=A0A9Q0Q6Z4_9ROSI|nr:GOLGIN CANDIDATE 5 [Salix koriyanagi]